MLRDDPNVYYIDAEESARCAVPDEPRGRAVDQRVARRLDAAVEEVRLELADEAREDSSDAGGGISPDVAGRLSAAQIRYLAALRLRPSVGVAMRMACRSAGSAVSGTQPSSMMRLPDVAALLPVNGSRVTLPSNAKPGRMCGAMAAACSAVSCSLIGWDVPCGLSYVPSSPFYL